MSEQRFGGYVDHIAVKSEDLAKDVAEYERLGFKVETLHEDWAIVRDPKVIGRAVSVLDERAHVFASQPQEVNES